MNRTFASAPWFAFLSSVRRICMADSTFTFITSCTTAGSFSRAGRTLTTPAQWTKQSTTACWCSSRPPSEGWIPSTSRRSYGHSRCRPSSPRPAASRSFPTSRPLRISARSPPRRLAMAAPMPEDAPVSSVYVCIATALRLPLRSDQRLERTRGARGGELLGGDVDGVVLVDHGDHRQRGERVPLFEAGEHVVGADLVLLQDLGEPHIE